MRRSPVQVRQGACDKAAELIIIRSSAVSISAVALGVINMLLSLWLFDNMKRVINPIALIIFGGIIHIY